jgi:hypothetical protein
MPTSSGSHDRVRRPPARFSDAEPTPPVAAALPESGLATGIAPNEAAIADHLRFDEVTPATSGHSGASAEAGGCFLRRGLHGPF